MTLTFTSGQTTGDSQCFSIAIYRVLIVKDTEFFSVNLTSTDSAVLIPPVYDSTIVTIYNNPENSKQCVLWWIMEAYLADFGSKNII